MLSIFNFLYLVGPKSVRIVTVTGAVTEGQIEIGTETTRTEITTSPRNGIVTKTVTRTTKEMSK